MKVHPPTTRSLMVLEMAAELTLHRGVRQATAIIDLGEGRKLGLFGSSTIVGIDAVMAREVDLAIVNPSATLTLAYRGTGPFETALPLRTIAVIPSRDEYLFAVRPQTGLTTFEEIARKRPALRIGVRGARDHSLHFMLDDIMRASGFSRADVDAWGGEFQFRGGIPDPDSSKFQALVDGTLDAIWDEGADEWLAPALDAGMTILSLAEPAMKQLEALGFRRAMIPRSRHPRLKHDILTVDFSGWPLFVRADLPDDDVAGICAALAARVERVPWQEEGELTVPRMVQNAADAPYDVPLHPAAERFWRQHGYLAS
jgi:TRAP-type uncharacterized transport system substrate-binding protein